MLAQLIEELEEDLQTASIVEDLTSAGADRIERRKFLATMKPYIIRMIKQREGDQQKINSFYKQLIESHREENRRTSLPINNIWQ